MGIPKKGSRKITVNGKPFLYLVKVTNIPDHADQKEIAITIQENCTKPGKPLQFQCWYGTAVTPSLICNMISIAKAEGWNPSERGGVFSMGNISNQRQFTWLYEKSD